MLQFPYQPVPTTHAPPSIRFGGLVHWRPFVPLTVFGAHGRSRHFQRALLDPGADDTVLPMALVPRIGISLQPDSGHRLHWRGQLYALRFGDVDLELTEGGSLCRWTAMAAFSDASIAYCILGQRGCLEFFDATFRGAGRLAELAPNANFPGTIV
ncbi:MAG: hypothetical protein HYS13_21115 [Planctomycetia bacterium]|nr:hypothetical protein [Planctomycetia bacterium]